MWMKPTKMDVIATQYLISHSDFQDVVATSKVIPLPTQGSNIRILGLFARVNTAFVGVTTPQISVGFTGSTTMLMPLNHLVTAGELKVGYNQMFCSGMSSPSVGSLGVIATVQSAATNLTSLTAGEVEIILVYVADPIR